MDKIKSIQQKIGVMKKDTQGYNYKYFDINQLLEKLTPLLHEEGLTLIQPLGNISGRPSISTIIFDGAKPLFQSDMPLPDLLKPQEMGSAITYYRRYSLQSLFALEAEDDDAESTNPPKKLGRKDYQKKTREDFEAGKDPLIDEL